MELYGFVKWVGKGFVKQLNGLENTAKVFGNGEVFSSSFAHHSCLDILYRGMDGGDGHVPSSLSV